MSVRERTEEKIKELSKMYCYAENGKTNLYAASEYENELEKISYNGQGITVAEWKAVLNGENEDMKQKCIDICKVLLRDFETI
jgi:hypothetical protein